MPTTCSTLWSWPCCAKPGDIIILSPASASFDLYPNFEVRGREFKKIVNELK